MEEENLKALSVEQLKKKEKNLIVINGIFTLLIIGLFYFIIRDYVNGDELDWSILTIAICTLGGPATFYPELQKFQKEISNRK